MPTYEDCPLTDTELELMRAAATTDDHSDENLARLSSHTEQAVKTMCRNIMHKLDVHTRGCAVMKCVRKGWVELPEKSVEELDEEERERESESVKRAAKMIPLGGFTRLQEGDYYWLAELNAQPSHLGFYPEGSGNHGTLFGSVWRTDPDRFSCPISQVPDR